MATKYVQKAENKTTYTPKKANYSGAKKKIPNLSKRDSPASLPKPRYGTLT